MNFNFNTFLSQIKSVIEEFLDLIYKRKCAGCHCSIKEDILCKTCAKDVQFLPNFPQAFINSYKLYSCFKYETTVKNIVLELKFKHNKACAYYIAKYITEYMKITGENFDNSVIIPIPTSKKNFYQRGFDNVLEIGKKLSELTGYKLNSRVLKKIKYTIPQYKLNPKQRKKNLIGTFSLNKKFNPNTKVILLDDIYTTGATLEVVTELFKNLGVKKLICITFAKTRVIR